MKMGRLYNYGELGMKDDKLYMILINIFLSLAVLVVLSVDIPERDKMMWCEILSVGMVSGNVGDLIFICINKMRKE